jgi:hypothetical protein
MCLFGLLHERMNANATPDKVNWEVRAACKGPLDYGRGVRRAVSSD